MENALFAAHTQRVRAILDEALEASAASGRHFGGLLIHAGETRFHHADDQELPFRTPAHFGRVAPIPGPGHCLLHRPDEEWRVVRVVPRDYWYAGPSELAAEVEAELAPVIVGDAGELPSVLGSVADCAYVGPDGAFAQALGIEEAAIEPEPVLALLDWRRAEKTSYEVECIREAARRASLGHLAAKRAASRGASERAIHRAYLEASEQLDPETPYPNIIAWDRHAAILHYQGRAPSEPAPGDVFLIDAGAAERGYASDITRTYARDRAPAAFRALLAGMARLQDRMVERVAPRVEYTTLHAEAIVGVASLLVDAGIVRTRAEDVPQAVARAFLPHGLGHHLGLQVHDVGGRQRGPGGGEVPAPMDAPQLRTTRKLEPGHVVTIEPGLYFIPMLLEPLRAEYPDAIDWALVDALTPCGGIRIEDDVLVGPDGSENLSRPFLPVELEL